ncbi:mandelate racemase/muconate lactonizing enzyme family protein [Flexithrix dorotheae]|uniref:mandelate racemase/muconate lactonizing enzyme family protein n=1 Tax=Flexithrix dorotheae TaxID=70993 RepID=UPI0003714236|nr:mandelate racemase/muconate lactonizing enzyme family protein [Flexithrix dorotheae]
MKQTRRNFLSKASATALGGTMLFQSCTNEKALNNHENEVLKTDYNDLDKILAQPVLKKSLFPDPVVIEKLELVRYENNFLCKVTSRDGAEGISVGNNFQMIHFYPIFLNRLQPFFIGKDARDWEDLLEEVYVYKSNYKVQNLALWVPLATIEFAVLDMLGKIVQKSIGELIGEVHHPEIGIYQANNFRGKSAEESIKLIEEQVQESNARAVKFKVGGRMSKDKDYPAGRTEKLIPLVRKTFGDEMIIYADSNGSYSAREAIRIGKIMEEYKYDFYEEPVPFDWYEETKAVTDALKVPIAGGEQEPSMHNFRWLIGNDGLDIVQPDIFYFGGMIRSMKVSRMAEARGKICIPHISGSGIGYLYMMHFVSAVPNAGPYHEFKGFNQEIPMECPTSDLNSEGGKVKVPTGPGLGLIIDPDYIAKHKLVKA